VCQRCDRLFDVDEEAVEHRIRPPDVRRRGFAIQGYSIYFTGLCAACQEHATVARPSRQAAAPQARTRPRRGRRGKRTG
jgi:hypothetical protein